MTPPTCHCAPHPDARFYGDDPARFPELQVLEDNGRFPAHLRLQCSICLRLWQVDQIPYGGLYGDFEWRRLEGSAAGVDD